jgi:hypothetical protein
MIKSFKQARVFALVSGTGDWLIRFAGDLGGDQDAPAGRASDRRKGRLVPIRLPTQPTPPMRRPIKGGRKEPAACIERCPHPARSPAFSLPTRAPTRALCKRTSATATSSTNRRLANECEYTKDENRRLSNECKKWKRIAIPAVVIVIVGLVMRLLDGNQLNLWAVIGLVCVGLWISFANTATRT